MKTYKEYIESVEKEWIGKVVIYEGQEHKVLDVDYNGNLLIDKQAEMTDTTSVNMRDCTRR